MDHSKARARRCAIYTRKSSEEGLEQDFNSLQAQREACEAFIKSQASEGWKLIKTAYDDGGMSGGTMERPALQRLLADIGEGLVDVVVVYKVDRLTRSLADFAKMVEMFDARGVSFVAVTQQFIYGPLPCAPSLVKGLSSDDPVAFIYPASLMGFSKLARGLDGNPRTLSSINTAASWARTAVRFGRCRSDRFAISSPLRAAQLLGWHLAVFRPPSPQPTWGTRAGNGVGR
jgi:hypothetical protein